MKNLFCTAFACALLSMSPAGPVRAHGNEAHATEGHGPMNRAGDPQNVTRTVAIEMDDAFRFTPAELTVQRGETVRFVVRNSGRLTHELVLGTADEIAAHAQQMKASPGMAHTGAHAAHVKPGATGRVVRQFGRAGEYRFACLLPGHLEAGMVGKLVVR